MAGAILLIRTPLTRRDVARYGVAVFQHRGIAFSVADLTEFLNPRYTRNYTPPDLSDFGATCRIATWPELFRFLAAHREHLLISSFDLRGGKASWIKLLLLTLRIRYLTLELNYLPNLWPRQPLASRLQRLLRSKMLWRRIMNRVRNIGRPFSTLIGKCNPPGLGHAVVCGMTALRAAERAGYKNIIRGHTMDYDIALDIGEPTAQADHIVFLDEYAPYHPDFLFMDSPGELDPDRYYLEMRDCFDRLEHLTGYRVVIAAHPRAIYEARDPRFGGREISFGQTGKLVASARLVAAHMSTAVNFAVIFERPVLFLTSDSLCAANYGSVIEAHAKSLGLKPVHANSFGAAEIADNLTARAGPYARYRDEFIKVPGSPELPLWDIVINALWRPLPA